LGYRRNINCVPNWKWDKIFATQIMQMLLEALWERKIKPRENLNMLFMVSEQRSAELIPAQHPSIVHHPPRPHVGLRTP
jgi:hypothetical protein